MESELSRVDSAGKSDFRYGLRENPRKTRRVEDLKTSLFIDEQKPMFCKQCGKGFKSMKALCGHMACHSEKDQFLKNQYSLSETGENGRNRPKKAKFCGVLNNDSSFVSESDFKQEEAAMCLIMLSRDYSNWVGVGSNQDSSDSVLLKTKSSSIDEKLGQKRGQNCLYESLEFKKLGKKKWKSENEDSTDEYFESYDFSKEKLEFGSRFEVYSTESRKNLVKGVGQGNGSNSKVMKFVSKNTNNKKAKNLKPMKKTIAHVCPYCNRVFESGQALGGHKRIHSLGTYGNRNNTSTTVFETETSEVKNMFNLNFPASGKEEKCENSQFGNW